MLELVSWQLVISVTQYQRIEIWNEYTSISYWTKLLTLLKTKQLREWFGMRFAPIVSFIHYCHITLLLTPTSWGGMALWERWLYANDRGSDETGSHCIWWKSTCYVYMYDWESLGWVLQQRSDKSVITHWSITESHWIEIHVHWNMDTLILEFSAENAITFVGTKYSKFGTTYPTGWKYTRI